MRLSKYEALKNNFLVTKVDDILEAGLDFDLKTIKELAIKVCSQNIGIGADDLLILGNKDQLIKGYGEFLDTGASECLMYLINPDGSIAEMTGNGSRCFAYYTKEQGYGETDEDGNYAIKISTLAGGKTVTFNTHIDGNEYFARTDMGKMHFEKENVPVTDEPNDIKVEVLGKQRVSYAVNTGIPHWVIPLDSLEELNDDRIEEQGNALRYDPRFPQNTNVNMVFIENPTLVHGRTCERGVGETLSCGTGITAMVAALNREGLVEDTCTVQTRGGIAQVEILPFREDSDFSEAYLYGPVNKIADIDFVV